MCRYMHKIKMIVIPSVLGVTILYFLPLILSLVNSFKGGSGGLSNYSDVISNKAFIVASYNSVKFTVICIPLLLFLSLQFALSVYNRHDNFSKLLKAVSLLPFAVPVSTIVIVWRSVFNSNGMLNYILYNLGVQPIDWLNSKYSFYVLVFTYIWKNLGYTTIIWIAGLNTIPKSQYEAANIDGATSFECFVYITLPNLKNSAILLTILSILNSFKVFREIYLIGGDYPNESIYMLQHLLNNWFRDLNLVNISVVGSMLILILSVVILLLVTFMEKGE